MAGKDAVVKPGDSAAMVQTPAGQFYLNHLLGSQGSQQYNAAAIAPPAGGAATATAEPPALDPLIKAAPPWALLLMTSKVLGFVTPRLVAMFSANSPVF